MPILDLPANERQEAFAFTILAVLLAVGVPLIIGWYILAALMSLTCFGWFVWALVLQPMFFSTPAELAPEEQQRIEAAKWMDSIGIVDPTTVAFMQRNIIALRKEVEDLKKSRKE